MDFKEISSLESRKELEVCAVLARSRAACFPLQLQRRQVLPNHISLPFIVLPQASPQFFIGSGLK